MKTHILVSAALACFSATQMQADWLLVENFENGLDNWFFSDPSVDCSDPTEGACDGIRLVIDDFEPGVTNKIGAFQAAAEGKTANYISVNALPLPVEILPADGPFTVYARFAIASFRMDLNFGLQGPEASELGGVYASFESQLRVNVATGGILQARDFDTFIEITAEPLQEMTWYEIWMVHDHQDMSFDVYIKGGAYAQQTLIKEDVFYRASLGEMRTFAIFMGTGGAHAPHGNSQFFIDDLHLDTAGINLETPLADTGNQTFWFGYPVDEEGWVSSAGWLGSVNVALSDNWVWSQSLNKFIYVPNGSGWIYLNR